MIILFRSISHKTCPFRALGGKVTPVSVTETFYASGSYSTIAWFNPFGNRGIKSRKRRTLDRNLEPQIA